MRQLRFDGHADQHASGGEAFREGKGPDPATQDNATVEAITEFK
jgi:hypothetical protein